MLSCLIVVISLHPGYTDDMDDDRGFASHHEGTLQRTLCLALLHHDSNKGCDSSGGSPDDERNYQG